MSTSKNLLDLKVQVDKRQRYFQRIQIAFDLIPRLDDPAIQSQFRVRCQQLDKTAELFEECQNRIGELNVLVEDEERVDNLIAVSMTFEDIFYKIKAAESNLPPLINTIVSPIAKQDRPKLPVINIPIFSGAYEDFSAFKSLYDTLVHNQPGLSAIEKFSYLRSLLSGGALSCIQGFSLNEENYPLAYSTLVAQFSNKRVVANSICCKLFSVKPCTQDSQLRTILDAFNVYVEALKAVGIPDVGDFLLLFMGLRLLDSNTRQAFENSRLTNDTLPQYEEFLKFIQGRVSVSELMGIPSKFTPRNSTQSSPPKTAYASNPTIKRSFVAHTLSDCPTITCPHCTKSHRINSCPQFLKLSVPQRFEVLRGRRLCFACFGPHPRIQCTSKFTCRDCGSKTHHSLLHTSLPAVDTPIPPISSVSSSSHPASVPMPSLSCGVVPIVTKSPPPKQVLLGTALVTIVDAFGTAHEVRVLVDPGSMVTIMTQSLCHRLCLPSDPSPVRISGIGTNNVQASRGIVFCTLRSQQSSFCLLVKAIVLPQISGNIPAVSVSQHVVDRLSSVQLADPAFFNPASIDLLLGAEYYADILESNSRIMPGEPYLVPSKFGLLVMGLADSSPTPPVQSTFLVSSHENELVQLLKKFWELEEVEVKIPQDPNDKYCEDHFVKTTRRDESGAYIVRLPFRNGEFPDLGNNYQQAFNRLLRLERSLDRNIKLRTLYHENLQNYIDSGHMVIAKKPSSYLMTHHGVLKESSSSTKVRVVFSPAEKSSPLYPSLNDSLYSGPKLQNNICDIMLNFRLNPIALTADIKQMYLSIKLDPRDSYYQQILWRSHPDQPIKQYEIQKVCFGVTSSPFHALRVLKQLIIDEGDRFSSAAQVVGSDTYIDDICTGTSSVENAYQLREELTAFLATAGFELRKWSCSHPEVLHDLPEDFVEKPRRIGDIETIRVLGLQWDPKTDAFIYNVDPLATSTTKRQILSQIARIYDLSGFVSPVTVWMKTMLQRLWVKGIDWDEPVPTDLLSEWNSFISDLPMLKELKIPRYILDTYVYPPELVGFSDASTVAMGVCVYLRVVCTDQRVLVNLIRAKSRVAPLKTCTVPRLELCAAHLLSQTIRSLEPLRQRLNVTSVYLFSDSMVFLHWLNTPPHLLKVFVANRIVKILEVTTPSQWSHIPTDFNPADIASRGCFPSQLVNNHLWWWGPEFLRSELAIWPIKGLIPMLDLPDIKEVHTMLAAEVVPSDGGVLIIERFSSFVRAQRVVAWILRLKRNALSSIETRSRGCLSVEELQRAEETLVRITQSYYLHNEITAVRRNQPTSTTFRHLTPFFENDILRVGGRLAKAPLPYEARHPAILPSKCHLVKLLIDDFHRKSLHGGNKIVQSQIQGKYYVPRLRESVRRSIRNCIRCFRFSAKPSQPFMSDLPVSRFAQGRPFIHTGVDLAGPYSLKDGHRRNSPIVKGYFAVFVCFSTKAIHLELLSSLSTSSFLASFDRFVARRGLPTSMFSDQGTNFKGASRVLDETTAFLKQNEALMDYLASREIRWCFNAPANPSAGGLWEAGVKSVKHHLKRVLTDRPLFFEEFSTVLARIEAILNSRPLGVPSSCPVDDISCLTPGHFLIGAPLLARPEHIVAEVPSNRLSRWELLQKITQHFWTRWSREYLHTLIQRNKWWERLDNVKPGDIAVLISENQPPTTWPLAKIVNVLPAQDGVVRVVTIRTASGTYVRPVRKLLMLPSLS